VQRTITGVIFVSVIIGSILLSPLAFCILFCLVALLSVFEFYKMVSDHEIKPQLIFGIIISFLLFGYVTYISQSFYRFNFSADINFVFKVPFVILLLFFMVFVFELFRKLNKPFINISLTLAGIFYIVLPFSFFVCIGFASNTGVKYHPHLLLGFLYILWANDTGAYVFGSRFGKHRLFERISPKKSWEGSIGGALSAFLAAYIISLFFSDLVLIDWFIMASIIIVAGTIGDLIESMLKRSQDKKDSGSIFPGHGGMLDRFDGLLLAAPFVFFYLFFFEKI